MTERTTAGTTNSDPTSDREGGNFVREVIQRDVSSDAYGGRVVTRFPPEPNGYLHIGHAKAIWLNFGLAREFGGVCHLRFDDTNPETEDMEYVRSMQADIRWLGYDWGDNLFFASDYFEQLFDFAVQLIEKGVAYVDSQSEEEIRLNRGTVTAPGVESPFRSRPPEESVALFRRMRAGEFEEGQHVLRARLDMASPNMKLRDPLLYRIKYGDHYRRGRDWCIYPMYDFAHPLSDAIENITHSICTLEFENNRPLYDWVVDHLIEPPRPYQYEFNRLYLEYTVMSKRKLLHLVEQGLVRGWDDPRMPTIAAYRRRGVTSEAIASFCDGLGVDKTNSRVDLGLLEYTIRNDLNYRAPRILCVLDPIRVVIENYPENQVEWLEAPYWPHDIPREGSRKIPFSREILIDRDDFVLDPPSRYHRLAPGREVRLRYGYLITCVDALTDDQGTVVELKCTYDPESRGGTAPDGRRVRGTLHWVSEAHALEAEVRLYNRLFTVPDPDVGDTDFIAVLNPESEIVRTSARVEPSVANDSLDTRYQFERLGYFWQDPVDSTPDHLVFNRIVELRDTWRKIVSTQSGASSLDDPVDARKGSAETIDRHPRATASGRRQGKGGAQLPAKSRARAEDLVRRHGLQENDALILGAAPELARLFEAAVEAGASPGTAANWIVNDVRPATADLDSPRSALTGSGLASLLGLIADGTLSSGAARDVLNVLVREGGDPRAIVGTMNLAQISDEAVLLEHVEAVVGSFPDRADAFRSGKSGLMGFFVGQVMKRTQGKANPELTKHLLERALGSGE